MTSSAGRTDWNFARGMVTVDDLGRSPAGKLDQPALRTLAARRLDPAGAGR